VWAGKQLAPINTAGVNTIRIAFNEHVRRPDGSTLNGSELKLYGSNFNSGATDARQVNHTYFEYNPATYVATWTFPTLDEDKYRIDLSAIDVLDVNGNQLDGEWNNNAAGTYDNFIDDPTNQKLLSGNGTAGSVLNLFRFFFSLLPGDSNQDGIVDSDDTSGTVADVNGDGLHDNTDTNLINNTYFDTFLPAQKFRGDFNDDEKVGLEDYNIWRASFGMSGTNLPADANNDGTVDAGDWLFFAAGNPTYGAWYTGPSGFGDGAPIVDFGNAPRVMNVTISSSSSMHDPYSFDSVDGSGEQLRTVPVGGADTISITFSEDVNVVQLNLRLVGLRTANVPTVVEFAYDISSMTATWRFDDLVANDHYVIALSDAVTDIEGNRLDGEWVNPAALTTTNALVSEFPSGDGNAGGHFNFVVTLLAGDVNRDNMEDVSDHEIIWANWGMSGSNVQWTDGDVSGDQLVSDPDTEIVDQNQGAGIYPNLESVWVLADLNGDSVVDEHDMEILGDNIGMANPTMADGDFNGDGYIDINDVDLMFAQYGLELAVVS
jgi:hypothetical protein